MPSEMEMQQRLEERMKELLEYANYQRVATALGVSRTAVWRWARGEAVTPGALNRVQSLLRPDTKEEAAPEGAAETLLRLWTGETPPPWAVMGRQQILEALESLRGDSMDATAEAAGRELAARLLPQLPEQRTPGTSGRSRSTPAAPEAQRR
jgi:transcriptional regulator with XRE-family HTH domain